MKSTAILAALIASLGSVAASAEPKAPPAPASELSAPARIATPATRYCIQSDVIGSRIPRRKCHTVAQWNTLDVDVLALAKR